MKDYISAYINKNLIDEYAIQTRNGYRLDIVDINKHEQENLISNLFKHDPVTRDLVLDRAQELINKELELAESKRMYDRGFMPRLDPRTGEVDWHKAGGF